MTDQEVINNEVKNRLEVQDEKFNSVMTRIDSLISELKEFKNEMRNKDDQRAADMNAIRNSIGSMNNHVRNLTITAMIGIGAMAVSAAAGIAAMVITVINK